MGNAMPEEPNTFVIASEADYQKAIDLYSASGLTVTCLEFPCSVRIECELRHPHHHIAVHGDLTVAMDVEFADVRTTGRILGPVDVCISASTVLEGVYI